MPRNTVLQLLAGLLIARLCVYAFNPLSLLSPTNVVPMEAQYDGFELKFGRFAFRPALFKNEAIGALLVLIYLAVYKYGQTTNNSRASAWINAHTKLYRSQFTNPIDGNQLLADGPSDYYTYSSGRRGLYSLHTVFTLLPRHDLLQTIFYVLWGVAQPEFTSRDDITLDFNIRYEASENATTTPGFVWAAVNKDELKELRKARWDLSAFTKITDALSVHPTVQVMTEVANINETLLRAHDSSLLKALNNAEALKYFRSLIVTDVPATRPDPYDEPNPLPSLLSRERHVMLTLSLPPTSEAGSSTPLVSATFDLIDSLASINGVSKTSTYSVKLAPETGKKLRETRREWDERIEKERTKERDAEAEEEKRRLKAEKKRKDEDAKLAKLGPAEQAKLLEKERKRSMRKAQMKSTIKRA